MNKIIKTPKAVPDHLSSEDTEKVLSELRNQVDNIDKDIASLLVKRIRITLSIAKVKIKEGLSTYSPAREKKIMENILSFAEDETTARTLRNIYERIIDESRAVQKLKAGNAKRTGE